MVDEQAIRQRLAQVKDPELKRDIIRLQMVRAIRQPEPGEVAVDVALTVAGCPLSQRIVGDIEAALRDLPGVERVRVNLDVMTPEERKQAMRAAFERPRAASPPPAASGASRRIGPLSGQGGLFAPQGAVILGIVSGKGGVGKSTVATNIAAALALEGCETGLMDLDVYGFSQGRMFGAAGQPEFTDDQKIIPWRRHGVHLVSMGMFVSEDQAIIWRGPMLGKVMDQFFQDVLWPDLDFLVLDLPPGTGDVALNVAQKLPGAQLILVTTPQSVAVHVARRAAEVARKAEQTILGVVENMAYVRCPHGTALPVFGEGGGNALADALGVPLLARVPLESPVREGGDAGRPVVLAEPDSEAGEAFRALAATVRDLVGVAP